MRPSPPAGHTAEDALALIKPAVRALTAYRLVAPAAQRKLNQNESPFDLPDPVKEAVIARVRQAPWNRYPPFTPSDLLERLARRHRWTPEGLLVGNGSNELIQATLAVTVGEGTRVLTPVPTFMLYRQLTEIFGGRHVPVPLSAEFQFDVDRLIRTARDTGASVILINSPNNPTGTPLPEGAAARVLGETQALLVMDEAYQDFGGPSAVPLLASHPRLVVLRSFSKAMSLAGLRFGYALAHPHVVREIAKAKLPYSVNRVTLAAAQAALDSVELLERQTELVRRTRDALFQRLQKIPGLRAFPSAANFVLIRCQARPAAEVFRRLAEEHGILVRDVSGAPGLEGCLRITAGEEGDVEAVAQGLMAILGEGS